MQTLFSYFGIIVIYTVLAMVVRYVFLKNALNPKAQIIFHAATLAAGLLVNLLLGEDIAIIIITVAMAVNIIIANPGNKMYEIIMIIPMLGITDGLLLPILILPGKLLSMSPEIENIYMIVLYSIILIALAAFYFFGKDWRRKFNYELHSRDLYSWERTLLGIIGIIQIVFSLILNNSLNNIKGVENRDLRLILILLGFSSFIMTITVIAVVLVGNKREYYHDKVSDIQLNIIVTMAEIVENRDKNTGGHIKRTAKYVDIIAKELRAEGHFCDILTDQYMSDIRVAAPLHDIGKIHISDSILNKPGRLTDEEFRQMKTHSEVGRDLLLHAKEHLGDFSYLDMAIDMAAYHHEWWNGAAKGYPDGLKGEEIPLCARIMAVADVFDALISKRCYKKSMPLDKAMGIIREESGTHFDPVVSNAFFNARSKIEEALADFVEEEEEDDSNWECVQTRVF